jgi:hypothetical protein
MSIEMSAHLPATRPHRRSASALALAATVIAALLGALPSTSSARPRTTYIIRDGYYGGLFGGNIYAMFWVSHRRVYHVRFDSMLQCYNISTHEEYPRLYDAGMNMPQGEAIPAGGSLTVHFVETEGGRVGHVTATFNFRRSGLAEFSVDAPHVGEGLEDCTGFEAIRVKRSPHKIPQPAGP